MELSFASAAWAWGLLSLALPILIHFFASRDQQPRRFAGMRFLPEGAEQGRARRISDWLLLLLRMLLLACLVAALMAPTLQTTRVRDQQWLLRHPALPALTSAEQAALASGTATVAYWLCPHAVLQPLSASCAASPETAAENDRFLLDLYVLAAREPALAALTLQVPPQLASSLLRLPALPFTVSAEVQPIATPTSPLPWSVFGPADYAPLFAAANRASAGERWRWLQTEQDLAAASTTDASRGAMPDVVIGSDDRRAAVRWHDQPLPWQISRYGELEQAFHLEGEALHLRVANAAALHAEPARLALLLQLTDSWLARGQLRHHEDSRALLTRLSAAVPASTGEHEQALRSLLLLAAVLLLVAERGLAHARR
ncbi:MAG TPA: BatA domain-containing protein [Permianibacter sp.]|nr:BatA domain-containing protein [Permianibacter sp.]